MEREMQDVDSLRLTKDIIYLDLVKALNKPDSKFNLEIVDEDIINIPITTNLVRITGELNFLSQESISAPITRKRAHYYVKEFAGGYSRQNKRSFTSVIYANGITKRTRNFGLLLFHLK